MAKKGMKRPGTGPEAQNQNPTAAPQDSVKEAKGKSNPTRTN